MGLLGTVLRATKFVPPVFFRETNRLVYWIGLPCLLFYQTAQITSQGGAAVRILAVLVIGVFVCLALGYLLGWVLNVPKPSMGAFVQGAYRGNLAFVGLPVILFTLESLGGATGDAAALKEYASIAVLVLAPLIPIYNVVAIVVLTAGRGAGDHWLRRLGAAGLRVLANPLVISCVGGGLFSLTRLALPTVLGRTLDSIGSITLPLALMGIGASLTVDGMRGGLGRSLASALIKVAAAPLAGWLVAGWMGLSPIETRLAMIYLATPTAAQSFVMAAQLGADEELTANIILLTVVLAIPALAVILLAT